MSRKIGFILALIATVNVGCSVSQGPHPHSSANLKPSKLENYEPAYDVNKYVVEEPEKTDAQKAGETVKKATWAGALLVGCLALFCLGSDDDDEREDGPMDPLWREGYGYNNPNPARKKAGLKPLNFDGSEHEGS